MCPRSSDYKHSLIKVKRKIEKTKIKNKITRKKVSEGVRENIEDYIEFNKRRL